MHRNFVASVLFAAAVVVVAAPGRAAGQDYVNFETGQVRPMALSPDGTKLYAVDTPDNRLEVFTVLPGGLARAGSVPVGLEPIAVAVRNAGEVWVVNHLSDSISVVDVATSPPRVTRTLLTCDEPRDIVFAGNANERAFVTTARRGQSCAVPFDFATAGIGRAVVQVFDATSFDTTLEGTPIANVILFADTPRALARSADGHTVYAAAFQSGNETTSLNEGVVCDGPQSSPCGAFPGGLPDPQMNVQGIQGPPTGLIVKRNPSTGKWEDSIGRDWSIAVRFDLPDLDVFAIDATALVPVETASFAHVGTVLFDMAVNPVSGKVYVSNTEARNEVRFEGPGLAFGSTTVQGHLAEARITVLDGATVTPRHLNKHIDYSIRPAPPGVKEKSLATPLGMAVTADGATLYVAAFGSSSVGVFDTAALENDTFVPSAANHIPVSGGGPTAVLLDEARGQMFVTTRFDDAISVVSLATHVEAAHVALHSPEPASTVNGRRFLYDASFTSSNGEASCASCHIFGDFDSLAWDLGNPDDVVTPNPLPIKIPGPDQGSFHPLKGPMTTQSLRGMLGSGSMHWRGDRTGGNDPGGDPFDEDAAFKKFNVAFPGLIGRDSELTADEMQAFTDFILGVTYPPNPVRRLDNALTTNQQAGHDLFFGRITDVVFNCDGCHTLDPSQMMFATSGFTTFEGETQMFKVPHLRNAYQKVGMFGRPSDAPRGPQVRGFGFLHDGSIDTVRRFLGAGVFDLVASEQNDLERFVMAMDSNLAPIVGQQITLAPGSANNVTNRITLMFARADQHECDIVVKGTIAGEQRGGYRLPDGTFQMDRAADVRADADLRLQAAVAGQELTYTCVPPGSAVRIGADRDGDGVLDRDELDVGADPADAASGPPTSIRTSGLTVRDDDTPPFNPHKRQLSFRASKRRGIPSGVTAPAPGSPADPTTGGALLIAYNANGGIDEVRIPLPAARWRSSGSPLHPVYRYDDRKRVDGPITSVSISDGKLRIRGDGAALYSLANAPQITMGLRLRLGGGLEFCAAAPAKNPTTANDTTRKFTSVADASAPAPCPAVP